MRLSIQIVAVMTALCGFARAQDPAPPADLHAVARRACGVEVQDDGTLVARGPDYRATFRAGEGSGVEYTPALGTAAQRSYPWRFALASITRSGGGGAMPLARHATPRSDGASVSYQHGAANVVERYDVRADGIEQSFVFAERPAGNGDLVVRGCVDTDLDRPADGVAATLRYGRPGLGGVQIGAVTGIDADGRRADGSLRVDGPHLELILPAAFVDAAAYPLVLDPLIGSWRQLLRSAPNDTRVDAAYEAVSDRWVVVWQQALSTLEIEIRGARMRPDGTLESGTLLVITAFPVGAGVAMAPSIATVSRSRRCLVAWQQAATPFGPWQIWCRSVDPATGRLSEAVPLAQAAGSNWTEVDVGGARRTDTEHAVVTYRENPDTIWAVRVQVPSGSGSPALTNSQIVRAAPGFELRKPKISQSGGDDGRYVIAWFQQAGFTAAVRCQAIASSLEILGATVEASRSLSADHLIDLDVDGDGTRFVTVWTAGSRRSTLYRSVLEWRGFLDVPVRQVSDLAERNLQELDVAVGYVGDKYLVAWTGQQIDSGGNIGATDLYAQAFAHDGDTPCGPRLFGPGSISLTDVPVEPSIPTTWAAGGGQREAWIVIALHTLAPPFYGDVFMHRYTAFGGGRIDDLGGGCGQGGTASVRGLPALGYPNLQIRLDGPPAGLFTVLNFGFDSPPSTLSCGPCEILLPTTTGASTRTVASGTKAEYSVPCAPVLVNRALYVQWITVTPGAQSCAAIAADVSFSNIVRMTFDW